VSSDLGQPRREPGAPRKLVEVRVCANLRFRHDVFGFFRISQHHSRDAIQPLMVAAHQSVIEGGFTCANPLDEFIVRPNRPKRPSSNIHKDGDRSSQKVTKVGGSAM
jgi:hypothetical protein